MSSILETFFFIFESDAAKLNRGLDDAEKKTEGLETGLQDADGAAGMLGGSLAKVAGAAAGMLASFLALGTIKAMVLETADAVDLLNDRAEALGLPVGDLDAWGRAALMTGGTVDGFAGSVEALNTGIVALDATGKGKLLPFLKEMGLSTSDIAKAAKDPLYAMLQMADTFKNLSRTEAAGLGAKLGFDRGTINLLSQGREGVEALVKKQREFGVVTEEQAELAAKFNDTLDEWNATFGTVKREFVTTILPPITAFVDLMRRTVAWMNDHKPFVVSFFTAVAVVLATVYAPAAWAAAAATWALIAPYVAVVAAVVAFAAVLGLVVDDLYAFGQGHDSVIGEISKKWPIVGQLIRGVGTSLTWLIAATQAFGQLFIDLIEKGPEQAIYNFSEAIKFLVSEIAGQFPVVGEAFDWLVNDMQAAIELIVGAWDWLIAKVQAGIELFMKAVSWFDRMNSFSITGGTNPVFGKPAANPYMDQKTTAAVAAGQRQIAATNSPIAAQTAASIASSSTVNRTTHKTVQTGPITINTQAADGKAIAAEMGTEMNRQMAYAIDDSDDGVAA